jgi:hypothetical protein
LLHGIFDYLTTSPTLRLVSTAVILGIWIWRMHRIEKFNKEDNGNGKIKKTPETLEARE